MDKTFANPDSMIKEYASINCDLRDRHFKDKCETFNITNLKALEKPYVKDSLQYFDENRYFLKQYQDSYAHMSKEACGTVAIENDYAGFTYQGDKNTCILYEGNKFEYPIEDLDKETINNTHSYLKVKNDRDINSSISNMDTSNSSEKYFKKLNHYGYKPGGEIKRFQTSTLSDCMNECLEGTSDKCKSVMYIKEPNVCHFFNEKDSDQPMWRADAFNIYSRNEKKIKPSDVKFPQVDITLIDPVNEYSCALEDLQDQKKCVQVEVKNKNQSYGKNKAVPLSSERILSFKNGKAINECDPNDTDPFCLNKLYPIEHMKQSRPEVDPEKKYTDCTAYMFHNPLDTKKAMTKACKEKYGDMYEFKMDKNDLSTFEICEDDSTKAKGECVVEMGDGNVSLKEHFGNKTKHGRKSSSLSKKRNFFWFCIILFLILVLGGIWKIKM